MSDKPNIILIITDQQRADTIQALGAAHMVTPNLDALTARGRSYLNCFTGGATCVTARAALFTGMWAHNTGIYSFNDWSHHETWVGMLRLAGYHCVNVGKMHIMPFFDPMSFDERLVVENPTTDFAFIGGPDDEWGRHLSLHEASRPFDRHKSDPQWRSRLQGVPWELDERLHPDIFVGDSAVAFLRRHKPRGPLFMQVGFTGPHEPYDPLPRHFEQYRDRSIPRPVWRDGELDGKPPHQKIHAEFTRLNDHESTLDLSGASEDAIVEMRRHYYANVTTIDEKVGDLLAALDEGGYLDNALVIFTSDHGDLLGDHRLPYKWLMYDPVVQVPLIVWESTGKLAPGRDDALMSQLDLGPTILRAAGAQIPAFLEGEPLQNREAAPSYVFCEDNYLTMVRSKDWKYVHYTFDEEFGELYDLSADPDELVNLFGDPAQRDRIDGMRLALLDWLTRSVYKTSVYRNRAGGFHKVWPLMPSDGRYLHPRPKQRPGRWSSDDMGSA